MFMLEIYISVFPLAKVGVSNVFHPCNVLHCKRNHRNARLLHLTTLWRPVIRFLLVPLHIESPRVSEKAKKWTRVTRTFHFTLIYLFIYYIGASPLSRLKHFGSVKNSNVQNAASIDFLSDFKLTEVQIVVLLISSTNGMPSSDLVNSTDALSC